MTAIQQYLHVDNEVYLVSSIYPVIQGGEGVIPTASLLNVYTPIEPYGVDSMSPAIALTAVQVVSVVKLHDQPYSGEYVLAPPLYPVRRVSNPRKLIYSR